MQERELRLAMSPNEHVESTVKIGEDLTEKLKLDSLDSLIKMLPPEEVSEKQPESSPLDQVSDEKEENEDEDDDEDEDFSFVCTTGDESPISADDLFLDGQIRPIFPLFNRESLFSRGEAVDSDSTSSGDAMFIRPSLRKIFVEKPDPPPMSMDSGEVDGVPVGSYCRWSGKAVEASPEICKKSNSTGFSKRWRFRELLRRSSSDGEDAFLILDSSNPRTKSSQLNGNSGRSDGREKTGRNAGEGKVSPGKAKAKEKKGATASSAAHGSRHVRNTALKGGDKRRSFLPYRPELVGFFTNVHGFSRNVHPF